MVPGLDIAPLQIPAAPRPVPRLNQHLRQWLGAKLVDYFDCQLSGAQSVARLGTGFDPGMDYSGRHSPVFWNAHLLALRESWSAFCGNLHLDGSAAGYLVWDLDGDQALNPATWFRGAQSEVGRWALPPNAIAVVLKRYAKADGGDESECVASVRFYSEFALYPTAEGMIFTPSLTHAVRGCEVDTLVPWRELQPFLTPEGARVVRQKVLDGVAP